MGAMRGRGTACLRRAPGRRPRSQRGLRVRQRFRFPVEVVNIKAGVGCGLHGLFCIVLRPFRLRGSFAFARRQDATASFRSCATRGGRSGRVGDLEEPHSATQRRGGGRKSSRSSPRVSSCCDHCFDFRLRQSPARYVRPLAIEGCILFVEMTEPKSVLTWQMALDATSSAIRHSRRPGRLKNTFPTTLSIQS